MRETFLMGRIIVGAFYIYNGISHFLRFTALTEYAKSKGVPFPEGGIAVTGVLLLMAGITFLLGIFPEIGVASVVIFFIPVTFLMHNFWAVSQEQKAMDMVNFAKNMALMGSALMFLMIKKPWPYSLKGKKSIPIFTHRV